MIIRHQKSACGILVYLCDELDHHAARKTIEELGRLAVIYPTDAFVIDLCELTFMDSSGIAVAINLQRQLASNGRTLTIRHASRHVMRIFLAAGLERFIKFEEVQA